jgi:hypothetical protein
MKERSGSEVDVPSEEDGDFAEEHSRPTYADEVRDGPEHARDPDSPSGLAGADPDQTRGGR